MGFAHWNVPHISLTPARGGSHRKDVGRILFWKRTRPTPRKKSTRAFRLRPGPPTTQRPGASAPAFGNQPPEAGAAARKHRHGNTIPNPDGPPIVPFPRKRAALSAPGGSFETHIREELARYGGGRNVVFDLQRLRMDFRLPARSGQGEPLTQAALDALIREHQPAVFFSKDLFARYFTYAKNGESHFILFDDADTLRQKLRLGRQLGVAAAFFQWPEVSDIADSLFRRG